MNTTTNTKKTFDTKTIAVLALLTAIAYILASIIRIPLVPAAGFLGYEPKDVLLVIAGFIYGPLAPLAMITIIAILEGVTTSFLGPVGIPMNFIASAAFNIPAAMIYAKRRTLSGAAIGLAVGTIATTAFMMLWNYILTPVLMGWPREQVVAILVPGIMPFNLIKGILNSALAMLLYKPTRKALEESRMIPQKPLTNEKAKANWWVIIISAFILLTCALVVFISFRYA